MKNHYIMKHTKKFYVHYYLFEENIKNDSYEEDRIEKYVENAPSTMCQPNK